MQYLLYLKVFPNFIYTPTFPYKTLTKEDLNLLKTSQNNLYCNNENCLIPGKDLKNNPKVQFNWSKFMLSFRKFGWKWFFFSVNLYINHSTVTKLQRKHWLNVKNFHPISFNKPNYNVVVTVAHYLAYKSKNIFQALWSDTDPVHMQLFPSLNIPYLISQVTQAVNQSCAQHSPLNTHTHILAWSTRRKQEQCRVVLVAVISDSYPRIVTLILFSAVQREILCSAPPQVGMHQLYKKLVCGEIL